jgi:NifU-like protein involved in Fe-S cluster formation
MNAPLYTTEILRLAATLPEPQHLKRVDGKSSQRSPTCGSSVATEVHMTGGRVEAISQTVSACAFGQASATLVAQQAPGRDRAEVEAALDQLTNWLSGARDAAPDWAGYEALAPALPKTGRHGAIMLPLRALLAAMDAAG